MHRNPRKVTDAVFSLLSTFYVVLNVLGLISLSEDKQLISENRSREQFENALFGSYETTTSREEKALCKVFHCDSWLKTITHDKQK